MSTRVLAIVTYLLAGYLVGLMIGLTVFDPDTDLYALLGAVLEDRTLQHELPGNPDYSQKTHFRLIRGVW